MSEDSATELATRIAIDATELEHRLQAARAALVLKDKALLDAHRQLLQVRDWLSDDSHAYRVTARQEIQKIIETVYTGLGSAGGSEPIRDAACLDAGCDIDGKEPHKPWCDNAPRTVEDQGNG